MASTRLLFASVLSIWLCCISPARADQDLGDIAVCRGNLSQVFLRTPGVLSSALWTITSASPGIALLSKSPDGPFEPEISFIVLYGSSGGETSTFYVQGVDSGVSLMTAVPDDPSQGRDTYLMDLLVDRVTGIQLVDTNDAPLETNPGQGGGLMKFTDVSLAEVSQFLPVSTDAFDAARTIRAKVALEGGNSRFPVQLRVFDVDDPENQAPAVDPNGTAGNDNIGTNGGPTALTVPSDTDGFSRADIKLSTQPGDNFRIAAGCDRSWLDSLVIDGTGVSEPGGGPPDQFKGRVSDMVTVWRYLHLEVDTMSSVQCNVLQGTVDAMRAVRGGGTKLELSNVTDICGNPFSLKQDTLADEFIGGALLVSGVTYTVVDSQMDAITVAGLVPTAAVGSTALLVDDDNIGGGPLDGDTDDPVPPPDLSLLQNSTDKTRNILAVAYVVPVADLPSDRVPGIQVNTPDKGALSAFYEYGWQAHDNDPNFWTGYVVGAYQGPDDFDDDPEANKITDPDSKKGDVVVMGLTDFNNTGSLIFAETIRDANLVFGPPDQTSPGCRPNAITAHEVVHLFDAGSVHLRNGNGLMSAACVSATNYDGQLYLADETVRTIRAALHP